MTTIRQWLHALLESKRRGKGEDENDDDEGHDGEAQREEPEGAGWTTDEDEEDWAKRFLEEDAGGSPMTRLRKRKSGSSTMTSITIYEGVSRRQ